MDVRLKAIQQFVQAQIAAVPLTRRATHPCSIGNDPSAQIDPLPTIPVTMQVSTSLTSPPTKVRKRNYRKPLDDQEGEYQAQQVYNQIAQQVDGAKGHISQATSRRLVDTYGVNRVGQGLSLITRRRNILNPAGFLVTWLRSESHQPQAAQP